MFIMTFKMVTPVFIIKRKRNFTIIFNIIFLLLFYHLKKPFSKYLSLISVCFRSILFWFSYQVQKRIVFGEKKVNLLMTLIITA